MGKGGKWRERPCLGTCWDFVKLQFFSIQNYQTGKLRIALAAKCCRKFLTSEIQHFLTASGGVTACHKVLTFNKF